MDTKTTFVSHEMTDCPVVFLHYVSTSTVFISNYGCGKFTEEKKKTEQLFHVTCGCFTLKFT